MQPKPVKPIPIPRLAEAMTAPQIEGIKLVKSIMGSKAAHPRGYRQVLSQCMGPDASLFFPLIHSTNMKLLEECPRKFLYRERLGMVKPGSVRAPLIRGTYFHQVSAALLQGDSPRDTASAARALIDVECAKLQEAHDACFRAGIPTGDLPKEQDSLRQSAEKGICMALLFHEKYPPDPARYKTIGVEHEVIARVSGVSRPVRGTLDLVLQDRKTGHIWIIDHKTTSKGDTTTIVSAMGWDYQSLLYRLLAEAAWPNHKIAGILYNVVLEPSIRFCPTTKDKDGFMGEGSTYLNRVKGIFEEMERESQVLGTPPPMLQSPVEFRGPVPRSFLKALQRTAQACRDTLMSDERFPKCGSHYTCIGMGGKGSCEYLPVCQIEGATHGLNTAPALAMQRYAQSSRDYPLNIKE